MDLQKVEDKVLPRSRKPPTSRIEGWERLKMETLGSELNPKTLKPGSEFQKCQMKGPVQVKNREW